MTTALSMYDVQCSVCKEWKHYKDEFPWKSGKRGQSCYDLQSLSPPPSLKTLRQLNQQEPLLSFGALVTPHHAAAG